MNDASGSAMWLFLHFHTRAERCAQPLTRQEFQPQTHQAVNWEKDAIISFCGGTQIFCFQFYSLIFVPHKTAFRAKQDSNKGKIHEQMQYLLHRSRKDKFYVWRFSLLWDSHEPAKIRLSFLIFLSSQPLSQCYTLQIHHTHKTNVTFTG